MDGNMTRPRIRYASICDPFIVILREDDTMGLFIGEPSKSKLRRKDMSMLGDRVSPVARWNLSSIIPFTQRSRYASASFYSDYSGLLRSVQPADQPPETPIEGDGGAVYAVEREATKPENERPAASQWLVLTRPTGGFEVCISVFFTLDRFSCNIDMDAPKIVAGVCGQ
jgi:cleavage and polyadenylation specificity factor subunit 1